MSDDPAGEGPRRNRVTPMGDIVATPLRGAWLGNRGILHRDTEIVRFHASQLWIICALHHKDWRLPQWAAGHFTVLFFHDEAVALAAGHRPCALCRRPAYLSFRHALVAATGGGTVPSAGDLDRCLQGERLVRGTHRRRLHPVPWPGLPAGSFVLHAAGPWLVLPRAIVRWTPAGYADTLPRPGRGTAVAITPPSSIAALRGGYPVQIDGSADRAAHLR